MAAWAAGRVVAMAAVRATTSTALVERRAGVPGTYEDDLMGRTSSDGFGSTRVRVRVRMRMRMRMRVRVGGEVMRWCGNFLGGQGA
ncbi:hypothetical protein GCM10010306_029040 [Streptomyces umbrinus]|nr:hypothetical protein GCM10010306_029040 [Streptomyces umbrinus]